MSFCLYPILPRDKPCLAHYLVFPFSRRFPLMAFNKKNSAPNSAMKDAPSSFHSCQNLSNSTNNSYNARKLSVINSIHFYGKDFAHFSSFFPLSMTSYNIRLSGCCLHSLPYLFPFCMRPFFPAGLLSPLCSGSQGQCCCCRLYGYCAVFVHRMFNPSLETIRKPHT